jgi:hypothetical protein
MATTALGCGDKYVVFGQGVRFQRAYAATHPASIVVYLKGAADQRERLLTILRMVGHRPQPASSIDELQAAVAGGKVDIVLTESGSVPAVNDALVSATVHPTIVPLLFAPTREQIAEIERQNSCAVQVSKRNHELLTVINDAMEQRRKGVTAACQRKRA